uniref:Protein FAM98A n=1 Tax=Glossina morsitans morsitans TaxID=37546 RepID=A0A1B0G6W2_GLOMM
MDSELDIIDSLNALNYQGKCLKNDELTKAVDIGIRSESFREVVVWLAKELHTLRKTDETVSSDVEDPNEFSMELSAMLKELSCPYKKFVTGPLSDRFATNGDRLQLLDYLVTELMATKMSLRLKPAEQTYIIPKSETNTARALENLTKDLCLGKPPENIAPKAFFDKLNFKVEERIKSIKAGILNEPLMRTTKSLTDAQWKQLEAIHEDLDREYNLRRQVLLTRLEVTIQSFQWSDKMRARENEIIERFQSKLKDLEAYKYGGDSTNIVALLAARADLAIIEKTSSANVRKNTASKIQKHVIGSVPDRGGRAHEHAPPPPEMPSWQQQRAPGPAGGGGRGGRGGGGSGGGGGHWQQFASQPQRQSHQQQQEQQQQYNQHQHFEQQRNQHWVQGSGRVQGSGWTQGQTQDYNNQGSQGVDYNNYQGGSNYRGGSYRGRSNYNRGGGQRR